MSQVAIAEPIDADELHQNLKVNLPAVDVGFSNARSFELMQRVAKAFSASTLVPQTYRGNTPEAIGNCMIALNLARRIGADPLMVMQNLNIVQGRPAWSSQFLIASVNTCGRFSALRFEFFGESGTDRWGCRAWAIEKSTGEVLMGSDVSIGLAKKEGWYGRNGSKWQTMPQQMLIYRSGAWWTKAYAPELSMGLPTADEAHDIASEHREQSRSFVDIEAQAEPKTIGQRLDEFANGEKTQNSAEAPHAEAEGSESSHEDAASEQGSAPPPSGPADGEGGADPTSQAMSPDIQRAYNLGRAACKGGHTRELPKNLKGKGEPANAFLRGWDDEANEADAAGSG